LTAGNVYIAGVGIISPLGVGLAATEQALRNNRSAIQPLSLFSLQNPPALPAAQVNNLPASNLPRTHTLALAAARQAMQGWAQPPDAVIMGTTTGGLLTTEQLLTAEVHDQGQYCYHGLTTVAEAVAQQVHCPGRALTVSTACSSGAVALSLALRMLQAGQADWILAGGADSLSHLTYFGFHSLQLVDPEGSRPFDARRQGMSVGEGAALLLLTTIRPDKPLGQLLGAGLSCDAYHPAAPHPQGKGAAMAMQAALDDAALTTGDIDYINLHGTGTPDNDLAEAKAIRTLFPQPPPLSSIKGATGHGLAAAGAIEAVVATIALTHDLLPANTGCRLPDPELQLIPLLQPSSQSAAAVLSNSFGFGGNNGCLLFAQPDVFAAPPTRQHRAPLSIVGCACLSGAGNTEESLAGLMQTQTIAGMLPLETISANLPARTVRRLKRFPRLALALAAAAYTDAGLEQTPDSVFMGSGWGALSETYDFLEKLRQTNEQFPSPTDFVGSVHNSAAGQIAITYNATGANITSSGGDYSFEQALLAADSLLDDHSAPAFVIGADEGHAQFSPLFDPSILPGSSLADGGGGFCLHRKELPGTCQIRVPFYQNDTAAGAIDKLIAALGGKQTLLSDYGLLMAGIPAAADKAGREQLAEFLSKSMLNIPLVYYRQFTGQFASASAVAAVLAVQFLHRGELPSGLVAAGEPTALTGKKILILGLGTAITAMAVSGP